LKEILVEFGATNVMDLAEVYPYMDLLQDIQSKVTTAEFKKFINAFKLTKVLEGTVLPEAVAAIINSKPMNAFSNPRQTRSTGWLGGLFGKDGNNEKVPFAQKTYGKVQNQKAAESEANAMELEMETKKKSKLIEGKLLIQFSVFHLLKLLLIQHFNMSLQPVHRSTWQL
jgi:hypothetical protein